MSTSFAPSVFMDSGFRRNDKSGWSASSLLHQPHDLAGRLAAVLLVEGQRLQRGLIAGDEEDGGRFVGLVHMLAPAPARHGEGVERLPVQAGAVDDAVAAPLEGSAQ